MSQPKKTLLACVSAAALVASIGFVQAQSPDEGAYPIANVNGTTDHGADPRAYAADRLPANNHEAAQYDVGTAATTMPDSSAAPASYDATMAAAPADTTAAQPAPAQGSGYPLNVGIDGTPCIPEGSAGQRSGTYDPAVSTCPTAPVTATMSSDVPPAPATPTAAAPTPEPAPANNMTVSDAPETRVDLSPPSDPLYNLPESGMRAPRPDRN